jgi:hypothetical protein
MLEKLFGNVVIEKVLFYILVNEKGYGARLSKALNVPLFSVQKALERLEAGGILVALDEGRTRIFRFNPRYPMLEQLKAFLQKAYSFLPMPIKSELYEATERRRPRRTGKPLRKVNGD